MGETVAELTRQEEVWVRAFLDALRIAADRKAEQDRQAAERRAERAETREKEKEKEKEKGAEGAGAGWDDVRPSRPSRKGDGWGEQPEGEEAEVTGGAMAEQPRKRDMRFGLQRGPAAGQVRPSPAEGEGKDDEPEDRRGEGDGAETDGEGNGKEKEPEKGGYEGPDRPSRPEVVEILLQTDAAAVGKGSEPEKAEPGDGESWKGSAAVTAWGALSRERRGRARGQFFGARPEPAATPTDLGEGKSTETPLQGSVPAPIDPPERAGRGLLRRARGAGAAVLKKRKQQATDLRKKTPVRGQGGAPAPGPAGNRDFVKTVVKPALAAADEVIEAARKPTEKMDPRATAALLRDLAQQQNILELLRKQCAPQAGKPAGKGKRKEARGGERKGAYKDICERLASLDEVSAMAAPDPAALLGSLGEEEQIDLLMANDKLRAAVISELPAKILIKIVAMIGPRSSEQFVQDVVRVRGNDEQFLQQVCEGTVTDEAAATTNPGTLLRANTGAVQLLRVLASTGSEAEAFLDGMADERDRLLDQIGEEDQVEVDVSKINQPAGSAPAAVIEESVKFVERMVESLLRRLYDSEIPPRIKMTAAIAGRAAAEVGANPAIIIGGHVLLRLINPLLVTVDAPRNRDDATEQREPKSAAKRRAALLASKVLQNIANQTAAESTKEPYMKLFVSFTAHKIAEVQAWLLKVAEMESEPGERK